MMAGEKKEKKEKGFIYPKNKVEQYEKKKLNRN